MSIFSNNNYIEESEIIAAEGYDIALGGACDLAIESCMDDMAVIEAMHAYDMAELEAIKESGDQAIVTPAMESSMKEVWAKIKAFFKKMAERIMGFFKSAMDFVNSIVMSGSAFAKKYKERLSKLSLSGFTYDMYEYNFESIFAKDMKDVDKYQKDTMDAVKEIADVKVTENISTVNTELARLATKIDQEKDKAMADCRKELSGTSSAEEYRSALAKKFRGGGSKKSLTITDLSKYVKFLESSNGLVKHINNCKNDIKTRFNNMEKDINKAAREAEQDNGDGQFKHIASRKAGLMRQAIQWNSSINNIMTGYVNEWSSVVKEATGVYKNLCFKAMQHKAAK